jgi:nitrite reductase/ring-hydroxylating ferredoxin subunit/uncharacterized membrane protein
MNPEMTGTDNPSDAVSRISALGELADRIQPTVQSLLEGHEGARRPINDVLHGRFLGHPLHPLITDIPIGAWTLAAVFDVLELRGSERYRDAADAAIGFGALGAVGAAITGLAEWSDTKDAPQRVGMMHGLLNTVALGLYATSFAARRGGARKLGIATAMVGYGIMSAAAYLGGELSFGMQLGVKHTALPIEPPKDFVRVLDTSALPDGDMQPVDVTGIPVLVTRTGDAVHAVSAVCTHRGAPLAEGTRAGDCITCPWHASRFSLADGKVVEGPATFDLARFDAQIAGGAVSVRGLSA